MPYIKEPDFTEVCVLVEVMGEVGDIYDNNSSVKNIVNKIQTILKRYKKHE